MVRSFVHDEHFTRWLLGKGAPADARGELDVTAVSVAIMRASMSTIRLLLHRSSGIQQGQLLHFALQRKGDDSLEIVELLLNLGCPIDSIWFRDDSRSWIEWGIGEAGTALFTAAEQGRDDMVAYLLSRGADATLMSNKGRTALDVAESKQRSGVVRLLRQ
jgi:ankyrin repeat protein